MHDTTRQSAIVPHVMTLAQLPTHNYTIATIERASVLYHTGTTTRIRVMGAERSIVSGKVWCLPDDDAWTTTQTLHAAVEAAFRLLSGELQNLELYKDVREEVFSAYERKRAEARNPLCHTIIHAERPDTKLWNDPPPWMLPRVFTRALARHTPEMYVAVGDDRANYSLRDAWFCPTRQALARVMERHAAAKAALDAYTHHLTTLGTVEDARHDNRYLGRQYGNSEPMTTLPLFAGLEGV